jgi:[ribosomal protein S18]-alanine N-acetyltransferase
MKARRESHIGFKGERFLLPAPAAQGPLQGQGARQKANRKIGVLKPARGKIQRGFKTGTAGLPLQVEQPALSEACSLNPLQHVGCPAAVVTDKPGIPEDRENARHDHVDKNETPHCVLLREIVLLMDAIAQGDEEEKPGWGIAWSSSLLPLPRTHSRYNGGVRFRIRKFEKADFDTLWRIDQECFDPELAYSRPELAFYMRRPGSFTLVAEGSGPDDGTDPTQVLGFIVAETQRKNGHIITIDVIAEARRTGVGSALLEASEEELLQAGAMAVMLETPVNNIAAIRFYKQKGYFVEKTVAGYYSNQMDALVMTKELARAVARWETGRRT